VCAVVEQKREERKREGLSMAAAASAAMKDEN